MPRVEAPQATVRLSSGEEVHLNRGRLATLWREARHLADACDWPPEHGTPLEQAVWLILAGSWPRRTMWATVTWDPHIPRLDFPQGVAPKITLTVTDAETTPDEVRTFYAEIQKDFGLGGGGRDLELENELLGLAAVEVIEGEGARRGEKAKEGKAGFWDRVLELWRRRAPSYGLDPDKPPQRATAHKRLRRLETMYARLVGSEKLDAAYGWMGPFRDRVPPPLFSAKDTSISFFSPPPPTTVVRESPASDAQEPEARG